MQIIFDSMTGNVRRFSHRLAEVSGLKALDLKTHEPEEPFLLITYTFGRGNIPAATVMFLEQHAANLCGVVASGSFHWGNYFALAGERIAQQYGVPLVAKLNKSGSEKDLETVSQWLAHRG